MGAGFIIRENVCHVGWDGCRGWYSRGHICDRDAGHKGACRCACGATTRRKRDPHMGAPDPHMVPHE